MERSLRDLGLAALDPSVNWIFPAVLFINGLHVSIQIGKVSLQKGKSGLFAFLTCIFDNFTKERALDLNSG